MLAQLLQQQLMSGFKTAQMNLLALNDSGIQHAADQPFRERIGHADVKQQVRLFAIVDDVEHLLAEGKHPVGIAKNQLPQLARLKPPSLSLK